MKERKLLSKTMILVAILLVATMPIWANNISIDGTVTLTDQNTTDDYTHIKFDISWENSWRVSTGPSNWDAAWVFAKWKLHSGSEWSHCTLSTTDLDHTAPWSSTIDAASDGTGLFIYRSGVGSGPNNWDNAKLRWNYGTDGVADDATVDVKVFAIEMVYVPEDSFYLGDGDSFSTFEGTDDNPVQISESETTVRMDGTDSYGGDATLQSGIKVDGDGGICTTGTGAIDNADYPTGYKAFYCMKYEISQGQYADFLNTITSTQAFTRFQYYITASDRSTISGTYPNYTASRPDRACNYLSIMDGMAYSDWAGLRPMTELEFEKACRGTNTTVAGEYAWGTNTICPNASLTISGTEDGTETITTEVSSGACCYGNNSHSGGDGGYGPLRVGIFAESGTNRISSGATFYGIMEMSGNLVEITVTLGDSTGRGFQGTHGNGVLANSGNADISDWPGYSTSENTGATGSGFRGGNWYNNAYYARVSCRVDAALSYDVCVGISGFRCVRSAPQG